MTEQPIMNLGCHVNVETMDSMKQYTNIFQVFIQPPVRFCFDEAKLLTTGLNLRTANPDCELVVHGPFWPNIQAPNRFITQSRKMLIQHMNVAKAMGAKYVVTHTGTRRITDKKTDEVTIVSLEDSFATITETLLSFLPSFQKSGVKLLLENTPSVGEKGCSATFILKVVDWFKERGLGDSIGLCFDCLDRKTKIETEEGSLTISSLYKRARGGFALPRVWSFTNGAKVLASVTAIGRREFRAGEQLIRVSSPLGKVWTSFDHVFFTERGEVRASELVDGDRVIVSRFGVAGPSYEVLVGTLMGDSNLYRSPSGKVRMQISQCEVQKEWLEYKKAVLSPLGWGENCVSLQMRKSGKQCKQFSCMSKQSSWLEELWKIAYTRGKRFWSKEFCGQVTLRSLVAWYYDDGSLQCRANKKASALYTAYFHMQSRSEEEVANIGEVFLRLLGFIPKVCWSAKGPLFFLNKYQTLVWLESVNRHAWCKTMLYKTTVDHVTEELQSVSSCSYVPVSVTRVGRKLPRDRYLYDLSVEGTHKYFAQHMLVHNTEHAWAHGTDPDVFPTYLAAADVIHLNSVPERCQFGEGLDRHTETPLFESYGIAPDTLVRWIKEYPNKLKILEQDTVTATKTFEWLRSATVPRILDVSK